MEELEVEKYFKCKKDKDGKEVIKKDRNGKKIIISSVAFKFRIADRKDWYESLYTLFSNETHNNLSSIEQKYIQDNFSIKVLEPLNNDFIERSSFTLLVILLEVIPIILNISEFPNEELEKKLEAIRFKLYNDRMNNNLTFEL